MAKKSTGTNTPPASETAVVKKEENAVSTFGGEVMPEYIDAGDKSGTENLSASDAVIPRLKIVNSLSKECTENGIEEGHFTNNVTHEDYGESVTFTPVIVSKGWIMFEGEGAAAKLISRKFEDDIIPPLEPEIVLDPDNQKWRKIPILDHKTKAVKGYEEKPPLAQMCYLYIGFVNGKELMAVQFSKSSFNVGKTINTYLLGGNAPVYAYTFGLQGKFVSADKGSFWTPEASPSGWTKGEIYEKCKKLYEDFKKQKKTANVQFEDETAPKTATNAPDTETEI